jgi:hypothetical protein
VKTVAAIPAFDPGDAAFNRVNAIYLAHAADVAYKRFPVRAAAERLGLRAIAFRHKLTRTRGYLGVCDTHVVLAFRGSDPLTLPNWITDAVVKLVQCDEYDGRVHHGFSSALRRTWPKIEAVLEEVRDKPLFVTGHSMGGALAVLTACRLAKAGKPPAATYTFGSPRLGDPVFCRGHLLPTYRVVNRLDLVPELPLASVRKLVPKAAPRLRRLARRLRCYGHVDTLVYLDRDGTLHLGADVEPWASYAVARAIQTRGKSFLEGVTDHLISSYIAALEGRPGKRLTVNRRRGEIIASEEA